MKANALRYRKTTKRSTDLGNLQELGGVVKELVVDLMEAEDFATEAVMHSQPAHQHLLVLHSLLEPGTQWKTSSVIIFWQDLDLVKWASLGWHLKTHNYQESCQWSMQSMQKGIAVFGQSLHYNSMFNLSCSAAGWQWLTTGGGGDGGIKSGRTTTVLTKSGLSASFSSFCTVAELLSGKVCALTNFPAWVCCSKDGRKDCCEEVNAVGSARNGSHGDLHIMFNHHYIITLLATFPLSHQWLLLCGTIAQIANRIYIMKGSTIPSIVKQMFNWGKTRVCWTYCILVRGHGGFCQWCWRA